MKKLFKLCSVLMLMIGSFAFGQDITPSVKTSVLNSQFSSFVKAASSVYDGRQTYTEFLTALEVKPANETQRKFYEKVYENVKGGKGSCELDNSTNAQLFEGFVKDVSSNDMHSTNVTAKKKWWQILINAVINVAADIIDPKNDHNIDLWPDTDTPKTP